MLDAYREGEYCEVDVFERGSSSKAINVKKITTSSFDISRFSIFKNSDTHEELGARLVVHTNPILNFYETKKVGKQSSLI